MLDALSSPSPGTNIPLPEKHELHADEISFPTVLIRDKSLTWGDRFLVVIINMLDRGDRYCYASNEYLAGLVDATEQSVANSLVKLKKLGWVFAIPNEEGRRQLTTRLREARKALRKPLTQISTGPYLDKYQARTQTSIVELNSEEEFKKREEESAALTIFKKYFPHYDPGIYQLNIIQEGVKDLACWESAVKYWAANAYQPRSVGKLFDLYDRLVAEKDSKPLSPTAVVPNDFVSCPFCDGGFKATCPRHKEAA